MVEFKSRFIGVAGTNGSGKDSLGEMLAGKYNFLFISMTDMLRDELRKQGKDTSRKNMRELSAAWRRESGLGVLIDKAYALFEDSKDKYAGLVVASLRNPGEPDRIHELGGTVVWVDADPRVRYERITGRGREDDTKTFEQFLEEEQAEMQHSGDEATLNMAAVKDKADIFISNDTNSLTDFEAAAKTALSK